MKTLALLTLISILTSCVTSPQPIRGVLFTNVRAPSQAVSGAVAATKMGESCSRNILSLYTWGDASIAAAKKNGQILEVATVDYEHMAVLSVIYSHTCTVVSGS